jgi:hypothetical protein
MHVQHSSHRPNDRFQQANRVNPDDAEAIAAASVAQELVQGLFTREMVKASIYHDTTRRSNFVLTGFGDIKDQPLLDIRVGVHTFMMDNVMWEYADELLYTTLGLTDAAFERSDWPMESDQEGDQWEDYEV